ncbi:MAG: hypothetical protein ACREF8_06440, partial [Chthoniobacterales bacterium]
EEAAPPAIRLLSLPDLDLGQFAAPIAIETRPHWAERYTESEGQMDYLVVFLTAIAMATYAVVVHHALPKE